MLQMKNTELTREVLEFIPLSRVGCDGGTCLPFDECQCLMNNGATLKDELRDLKRLRDNFEKNDDQHLERGKRNTKNASIANWTKARMIQKYDECEAPRCFFSCYAPGHDKGPKKEAF